MFDSRGLYVMTNGTLVRHFGDCGVNNVQPVILEKVCSSDLFTQKAREQFFIDLLETEINAL